VFEVIIRSEEVIQVAIEEVALEEVEPGYSKLDSTEGLAIIAEVLMLMQVQ
jgi:hypothetical protein